MATLPKQAAGSGGGGGWRVVAAALGVAAIVVVGALAWQRYAQPRASEVAAGLAGASPGAAAATRARTAAPPTPLLVAPFDTALILAGLDDSYPPEAIAQTARLVRALPPRIARAGRSVAEIIRAEYGLTAASRPATYAVLESEIQRLNPTLPAGPSSSVLVPAVPHLSTAPPSERRYNVTAQVRALDGIGERLVSNMEMLTVGGESPRRSIMRVRVPVAQLRTEPMSDLIAAPENTLVSFPLNVTFAQGGCSIPYKPFLDRDAVAKALEHAANDATLYILDTGWPDAKTWVSSRKHLSEMCVTLRQRYLMDTRSAEDLEAKGTFPPPTLDGSAHSQHIQHALLPFDDLDPHVHVVYVPMVRDQGSQDVLAELLALRYIRANLVGGGTPPSAIAPAQLAEIAEEGRKEAQQLLGQIPEPPKAGGSAKVDGGIVSALLQVATAHAAEPSGRTFFVNESWWSRDIGIKLDVGPVRAFVVAAVGNDKGKSVDDDPPVLFAGKAPGDPQTLAVMTLDRDGSEACCTSVVDYDNPQRAAAGYYGAVDDKTCGSSFAAPRVAWVLAARETLHPGPIKYPVNWATQIKERLGRHPGTQQMPAALLFDPVRYLRE